MTQWTEKELNSIRPQFKIHYTIAQHGAKRLRELLKSQDFINALGAMTGGQAVQQVRAGLKSIYVSGWQTAADANLSGETYPDQSLYPANSVPALVRRINKALQRADEISQDSNFNWYVPIVADAEAGFGGPLNAFELMKAMIEAGAAGVHFEDQLSSEKKCGHLGGKVLVPTSSFIKTLKAADLARKVMEVDTVLIARTDANAAKLLTSDIDEYDHRFMTGNRTKDGFWEVENGLEQAIARGLAYAPYCDMIWCETSHPDLNEAKEFACAIHEKFPDKMLAYNCSPSFNWSKHLSQARIESFQNDLAQLGYKYQFITLAGWHSLNYGMFDLAMDYRYRSMAAYNKLQIDEFNAVDNGYTAVKHQQEVGTGYFDRVRNLIDSDSSTSAMKDSTEEEQF